jgi:flagellar hook-basal body complex protein FliE
MTALAAARAYGATQALPTQTIPSTSAASSGGFGQQLANVMGQATRDIAAFDQKAAAMATGKADLVEVVQVICATKSFRRMKKLCG